MVENYQERIRERKRELNRDFLINFGVVGAVIGLLAYCDKGRNTEMLAHKLDPYVERADGQPGISLQDRLDFAERAGLSDDLKRELGGLGYDFNLRNFPNENLERALQSYKSSK